MHVLHIPLYMEEYEDLALAIRLLPPSPTAVRTGSTTESNREQQFCYSSLPPRNFSLRLMTTILQKRHQGDLYLSEYF